MNLKEKAKLEKELETWWSGTKFGENCWHCVYRVLVDGVSQAEAAREVNVSPVNVCRWVAVARKALGMSAPSTDAKPARKARSKSASADALI